MEKNKLAVSSAVAVIATGAIIGSILGSSSDDKEKAILARRLISERLAAIDSRYEGKPLPGKFLRERNALVAGLKDLEESKDD